MQETSLQTPIATSPSPDNQASMPMPTPKRRPSGSSRRSKSVAWFLKPAFVALVLVVAVLTIGWGAYNVVIRSSPETDAADLADLEDFDLDSPSPGQADEPTDDSMTSRPEQPPLRPFTAPAIVERAPQIPVNPSANSLELPPVSSLPSFQSARYERDPARRNAAPAEALGVWLSGTIEDSEETPARIALPSRVSQAIVDGPAIR